MTETSEKPQPTGREISRRKFFFVGAAMVLGGVGGGYGAPKAVEVAHKLWEKLGRKVRADWYGYFIGDEQNQPVGWTNLEVEVKLDSVEMKAARERALALGEVEFVKILPIKKYRKKPRYESDRGHFTLKEKPKDVLDKEQLEKRGVYITQADTSQLFIRAGAFSEGGPLESFTGNGKKLNIVLVDSRILERRFVKGQKYAPFRHLVPEKIPEELSSENMRVRLKQAYEMDLQEARDKLKAGKEVKENEGKIWKYKKQIFMLDQQVYDDEEIAMLWVDFITKGYYYFDSKTNTATIFLCVGRREEEQLALIYFDKNGRLKTNTNTDMFLQYSAAPRALESHPEGTSRELGVSNEAWNQGKSYFVEALTSPAGFSLRHELAHIKTGNEFEADRVALEGLGEAWLRWRDSEFGKKNPEGDAGYHFVFSLPKEEGGGYIITQKNNSTEVDAT